MSNVPNRVTRGPIGRDHERMKSRSSHLGVFLVLLFYLTFSFGKVLDNRGTQH